MFKRFLAAIAAAFAIASMLAAQQPELTGTVKIARNTLLQCALMQPLDPTASKPGDDVALRLTRSLSVGGVVMLPTDSMIHGKVTKVTPPRPSCERGAVGWKLEEIPLPEGGSLKVEVWRAFARETRIPADANSHHTAGENAGYVIRDVAGAPIIVAGLTIAAGKAVVTEPFRHGACRSWVNAPLPANATVGIRVREDQSVRY